MARKPLAGTVAACVLQHGTGALNVDGCRVSTDEQLARLNQTSPFGNSRTFSGGAAGARLEDNSQGGRWPANLIHSGCDEVVGLFPGDARGAIPGTQKVGNKTTTERGNSVAYASCGYQQISGYKEEVGSAARFFYCAKASKKERGEGNNHPTVKPIALMQYLCRLVTPPGGTVLDPFMGSGSTGIAALQEGFSFVGIEQELEYVKIAKFRIDTSLKQHCLG
jgi:site-specific DNA-methyltransferase (adenine-specific)